MHSSPLKRWLVGLTLLAVLLFSAYLWLKPLLSIGGGYAAKHACSCHFLQGRELAEISENDLNFSVLGWYGLEVEADTVRSSILGLVDRQAVHLPGRGCVLINAEGQALPTGVPIAIGTGAKDLAQQQTAPTQQSKYQAALAYGMQPVPGGGARGIVVLQDGKLLAERYAEGYDRNTPLLGWSMTKTVTGLLVGFVSRVQGDSPTANRAARMPNGSANSADELSDSPSANQKEFGGRTANLFPTAWTDKRAEITLADLLHMNSGLAWNEGYGSITDATVMLHERPDFADFALRSLVIEAPGTVWNYSSGTTNIVMEYLRQEVGGNDQLYALIDSVFGPIAPSLLIEPDQSGRPVGSSYGWATARDWARLGQFMLQDGVWDGRRILPPGWIDFMREPAAGSDGVYGGHLWLPGPDMPSLPADAYMMRGFQDQRVFVIPSRNMVIARLGHGEDKVTDFDGLVSRILAASE
ncbi:serine hydrolase domain-containing protein [Neolewinella sp.]|uniref:serine hydrolase domain-containing protein n=1 Tax=Neolewinella sp. TaxID=2993543 RepID=UPI003B516DA7